MKWILAALVLVADDYRGAGTARADTAGDFAGLSGRGLPGMRPLCGFAGGRARSDQSNDEAVRILTGTCDNGYAPACTQLGIWNESGVQMNPNRERANSIIAADVRWARPRDARLGTSYEQGTG
jgi:hypothetical protein